MDILIVLPISAVLFTIILRAETSASQFVRQKFILIYFAFAIIGMIVGLTFIKGRIDRTVFAYALALLGCLPPVITARLVSFFKNKEKPAIFRLTIQSKTMHTFLIVLWTTLISINIFLGENVLQKEFDDFVQYFVYSYG
jgi:hypothetical protein